jgi:hypothetical protein
MEKVELIYEHWYAPSLRLDLLQVVYGGDLGMTTDRISNLKMEEPDEALFQAPRDLRAGHVIVPRHRHRLADSSSKHSTAIDGAFTNSSLALNLHYTQYKRRPLLR